MALKRKSVSSSWSRRKNKYNAKRTLYRGHWYHSMMEADYARLLDRACEKRIIAAVERQISIPLLGVGSKPIGSRMVIDFSITKNDGDKVLHEVKGFETDVFKLKHKILKTQGVALSIIKRNKGGFYVAS